MFEDVRNKYFFSSATEDFYNAWSGEFVKNFTPWLDKKYLEDINEKYLGLENEPFDALCTASQLMLEEESLCSFAGYCRALLFESNFNEDYLVKLGFPKPATGAQLLDDFFGLLVHLSGIDIVEKRYLQRNIPLTYMKNSYKSVYIWVHSFFDTYGKWGHNREFPRMIYIENLRIIRIGRLEFETNYFKGNVVVLKNNKSDEISIISEGGIPILSNGYIGGTNGKWDKNMWFTFFNETEDFYEGNIVENEKISKDLKRYDKTEWSIIARKGVNSLNIHIPRDGRLDLSEVCESIKQAKNFYDKYFKDRIYNIFECHSWLFDPQLPKMLGEDSGIVKFRKIFNLFPEATNDFGAMVSVFTEKEFDIYKWQATTTLQRKIIEHYKNSGKMFAAGGIIVP